MDGPDIQCIIDRTLLSFPSVQAIYCFGSQIEGLTHKNSDVDVGLLLPHEEAKRTGPLAFSDLRWELEDHFKTLVDIINIRLVNVVFRKEIVMTGSRIYNGTPLETDIFEMLTLSFYQKLNEERKEIIDELVRTGRAYNV